MLGSGLPTRIQTMPAHFTNSILMVRPAAFRANPGTMASNAFQDQGQVDPGELQARALAEFDGALASLEAAGVRVLVLQDDLEPETPDSIFPNNWFTTHGDGTLCLFPMEERSRRAERRLDLLLPALSTGGFDLRSVDDSLVQRFESRERYLEGTGSMVLDRGARIAFACASSRTHGEALEAFCELRGYRAQRFEAIDGAGLAYYHTNVILALGQDFAVLCLEAVPGDQRAALTRSVSEGGRKLVTITRQQAQRFAGNLLELRTREGGRLVLLSCSAEAALEPEQLRALRGSDAQLLALSIPNIERYGGGGVRCMLAEIFLPRALDR